MTLLFKNCPSCGQRLLTMEAFAQKHLLSEDEQNMPFLCLCEAGRGERAQDENKRAVCPIEGQEMAIMKKIVASGMPKSWVHRKIETYEASTASEKAGLAIAQKFLGVVKDKRTPKKGLLIIGNVGTGKTHLASCLARSVQDAKRYATWRNLSDLLLEFRETYKAKNTQSEQELIRRYAQTDFLFLDDLGKEKITDWAQGLLFAIVNKRTDSGKPLIITANYGRDNLIKRLTPIDGDEVTAAAIVDRIIGNCVTVVLKGESRREATLAKQEGETST